MNTSRRRGWSARLAMSAAVAAAVAGVLPATATAAEEPSTNNPLIVGGHDATEPYPWMGSLQFHHHPDTGEEGKWHNCGVMLTAPDTVVTAGHCVTEQAPDGTVVPRDPSVFQVMIGSPSRIEGTVHLVRSIEVHKDWHFAKGHDIATVHLTTPVIGIKPLPIAEADDPAPQAQRRILGWGGVTQERPNDNELPLTLQEKDAALAPDSACKPGAPMGIDSPRETCVVDADSRVSGVCYGDSGGPLIRRNENGEWELEAITSRGLAEPKCGTGRAIFTDATRYADWVATH